MFELVETWKQSQANTKATLEAMFYQNKSVVFYSAAVLATINAVLVWAVRGALTVTKTYGKTLLTCTWLKPILTC